MGRTLTATLTLSLAILVQLKIRVCRESVNNILCSRIHIIHIMYSKSLWNITQHSYTQADLAEVAIFATLVIHHPGPQRESSSGGPWLRAAAIVANTTLHFNVHRPTICRLALTSILIMYDAVFCFCFHRVTDYFLIAYVVILTGNSTRSVPWS